MKKTSFNGKRDISPARFFFRAMSHSFTISLHLCIKVLEDKFDDGWNFFLVKGHVFCERFEIIEIESLKGPCPTCAADGPYR